MCIDRQFPVSHTQKRRLADGYDLTNRLFCVWPVHILKTIHRFSCKAVYRFPESTCPYTNWPICGLFSGAGPSKMCMKRKKRTIHTQRACCSAPGTPALSPGPSHSPGGSCRAARPAGRPRELTGERTGMNRRYVEKVRRMHRECTDGVISCIRSTNITPGSSYLRA